MNDYARHFVRNQPKEIACISKFNLMQAFLLRAECILTDSQGIRHQGVISSLQHEDGSGRSFNVCTQGGQCFHIRTVD